ncbi:papain-like cysteine protease family protein [Spirillospora sp. NPDC052269]
MEHQQQTNWCWVATAVSVSHYYEPASVWLQCLVIDDEFGYSSDDSCCRDDLGPTPACNQPGSEYLALKRVGHSGQIEDSGSASLLENEIAARRPIVTAIAWSGGGGHSPLISGYADIVISVDPYVLERYLYIEDPFYGQSFIPYDTFHVSYQGSGQWTRTYYTT